MSLFYCRSFLRGGELIAEIEEKDYDDPKLTVDNPSSAYQDENLVSWRKFSTRERANVWAAIITGKDPGIRNFRQQVKRWHVVCCIAIHY